MSEDIGPGDVVEAWGIPGNIIPDGTRAIVTEIGPEPDFVGHQCHLAWARGLKLLEFPTSDPNIYWCPCVWRKVGGSRSDTVHHFAEDLNAKQPRRAKERV